MAPVKPEDVDVTRVMAGARQDQG